MDKSMDSSGLVSVPNSAVIELTTIKSIRMINLDTPAKKYGFYEKYPFYLPGSLPEGAYDGKVEPVKTILMPTILIAHKDVSEETIYAILKHVYSPEGHQMMLLVNQAAADMTIENGPKAFVTPLHRGAYKFWNEQGVEIPCTRNARGISQKQKTVVSPKFVFIVNSKNKNTLSPR